MIISKSNRNKRSRISSFKQPFIAGMLTSTSLLAGCVHHPDPPDDGSVCPAELPSEGQSCAGYVTYLSCGEPCTEGGVFRCGEDGKWSEEPSGCNPPPPLLTECPIDLPTLGESCGEYEPGLTCFSHEDCGTNYGALCGESGTWEDVRSHIACNPPIPVPVEASVETDYAELDAGVAQE